MVVLSQTLNKALVFFQFLHELILIYDEGTTASATRVVGPTNLQRAMWCKVPVIATISSITFF